MNWLLYGTIGILAVGVIVGYMKGALRIALSLAAAVATWILVVILTPYAADAVIQYTPVDDWIEERCESVLTANMTEALREQTGIETQANGEENLDLSDLMDRLSDIEVSRQEQAEIIENSNIPEISKEYLQENNNKEIYGMIGANSFADYIAKGITHLVVQILTAIVLFLVISIVLKIMIYILDVVSWLPIIGGINRVVGAVLGFAMALILVWIVFLIFTMLYTTQAGQEIFRQINGNAFLRFLFQNNYILKILMGLR